MSNKQNAVGRKEWLGLFALALPTLLLSMDVSVLYLALPRLSAALDASTIQQLWIIDIYSFMVAGFMVTMGTVGDRIGRRKLLLFGAAVFSLASIAAAFSRSPDMLIASRVLLGIAAATLPPSMLGIIRVMFPSPKQLGQAIGIWMSCFLAGTIIGPLLGGVLLQHYWWGSVFLMGVPVMLLLMIIGPLLLPEYRDPKPGKLDLISVSLSLAAILPTIYGLKELARNGWSILSCATMVAGILFGFVFVRRERRLAQPLLDIRLFANRAFSTALGVGLVGGIVMGGLFLYVTLYLQMVQGLSPLHAGLWLVPQAVAMITGSLLAPRLARRIRPAYIMSAGLAVAALGLLLITQVHSVGGLGMLVSAFVVLSLGLGMPMSLGTGIVLHTAPPEKAGSAGAISETSGEFGIAVGIATLGSVGTAVYRDYIAHHLSSNLPAVAVRSAHESLTSAVTTATQLPAREGAALLTQTRAAFTSGMHLVAFLGAGLFLVFAVLTLYQLRFVPPLGNEPEALSEQGTEIGQI